MKKNIAGFYITITFMFLFSSIGYALYSVYNALIRLFPNMLNSPFLIIEIWAFTIAAAFIVVYLMECVLQKIKRWRR